MKKDNEKGFALILSLVLLLVMSLMGGSLIVIAAGDHQNNNTSDTYQQTFYVAETALLEGEKYIINQYLISKGEFHILHNLLLLIQLKNTYNLVFYHYLQLNY